MKCKNCDKEFNPKRKTARFCSSKCRKLAFHSVSVSVPKVSVPDKKNSVPEVSVPQSAKCKNCKKEVHRLVDICPECVQKGITRKKLNLPDVKIQRIANNKIIPLWKKLKIREDKRLEYVLYCLKKNEKKIGSAAFVLGDKIFEIGKIKTKEEKIKIPEYFR